VLLKRAHVLGHMRQQIMRSAWPTRSQTHLNAHGSAGKACDAAPLMHCAGAAPHFPETSGISSMHDTGFLEGLGLEY